MRTGVHTRPSPGIHSFEGVRYGQAADSEYGADDFGEPADALHSHGFPGLSLRAHRRGRDRPIPACHERGAAGQHLRHKRHTLCRDAPGERGAGHGPRGRGTRGDGPFCAVRAHLRLGGDAAADALCRAGGLPVDRRRAHGDEPAHPGLRAALPCALKRDIRLFHRLRADMEALAGAPDRAVRGGGVRGALPGAGAGGGHRAQLCGGLRGSDGLRHALACADARLLSGRPAQIRLQDGGEHTPDGPDAVRGPASGCERLRAQRALDTGAPAGASAASARADCRRTRLSRATA